MDKKKAIETGDVGFIGTNIVKEQRGGDYLLAAKASVKEFLISIIIVTYNSSKFIEKCINSIYEQGSLKIYPFEIIIVDNCSTDDTIHLVQKNYPSVIILKNDKNRGYSNANNLGACRAEGEFLIILNPDTICEENSLNELIIPLFETDRLITTPKILIYNGSMISTCGNLIHFTGLAFPRGYGSESSSFPNSEYVCEMSGCCFAIRRKDFFELNGFDESFFLYHDDVDLSCRAHLKGYKILYVSTSVIRHNHLLNVLPKKIYYLEKGRYVILRKYFTSKELLLMSPSLLIAEVLTFGYSLKFGWKGIAYKLKSLFEGLTVGIDRTQETNNCLIEYLCASIPIDQLTSNKIERDVKILANMFFLWNMRILKWK